MDDPLELGVGHLPHVGDVLNLLEGLLQNAFQLFALCQMVGHHFQLVFQPFNLFPHPADLIVEFLAGDQIVSVHIHVFLPGLLQLGKLGGQFFFVVQVFVLCLIDPLEFSHYIADDIFLGFQQPGEIFLQNLDKFIFIHRHGVRAVVRPAPVVAGADPADIGVFVGADGTPEGPAALLAFDKGGKQVFVALALLVHLERLAAGLHNLLRLFKGFRVDDPQVRAVNHHPLRSVLVRPLAG